ncbi:MAG: hemolysin family protein [Bacteroidales bacterium]|jgi:putative hemolysin
MEIFLILGLIFLNGLLSMFEIAVISSRTAILESEAKKGSKSAKIVLKIKKNPNNFLSSIQIGITLIGILTGLFSGAKFAKYLSPLIAKSSFLAPASDTISQVIIVIVVTYLTLVFGELVPKKIGLSKPEKIAKVAAGVMHGFSVINKPLVYILSKSTEFFTKLFGVKNSDVKITEAELRAIIRESREDGEIQDVEHNIVERVFNLSGRKIEAIMTHRSELVWLDINDDNKTNSDKIKANLFNMYPVSDDDLDDILGVVYLKDLFGKIDKPEFKLQEVLKTPQYLPESLSVYDALDQMKEVRLKSSIVIDEFGSVLGIVTVKDIVEELIGNMPEIGEEQEIIQLEDGRILVDGQCPFYDFLSYFDLEDLYEENSFVTISGLILEILEHIPVEGEKLSWHKFNIEVVDMDGARIDKVIVKIDPNFKDDNDDFDLED